MSLINFITLGLLMIAPIAIVTPTTTNNKREDAELPTVDLGYVMQQASEYNATGDYYVYRNIRFAAPPTGDLRFRKPADPLVETNITNGDLDWDTQCSQVDSTTGAMFGSEDCLFLDVYVNNAVSASSLVPVLAWFYGGSYVSGSKESAGTPFGLLQQTNDPFVFVAANYRLGSFGWLAPPDDDVDSNIGLHDAKAAMDWISTYIEKFGGDMNKFSVMGESAGAGILTHIIASNGGEGEQLPFQKAILQSPGWMPEMTSDGRQPLFDAFASFSNCSDAACLRLASEETLQTANLYTMAAYSSGALGPTSGFFPLVDGDYIPDTVPSLLAEGKFHSEIESIVSSSCRWEGGIYLAKDVTEEEIAALFVTSLGNNTQLLEIFAEYYNEDTIYERAVDFVSDIAFSCNGLWLSQAFESSSRRYMFNVGDAIHADDVPYTFYEGDGQNVTYPSLAEQHQYFLTAYTIGNDLPAEWPLWEGTNAMWMNETGVAVGTDYYGYASNAERCEILLQTLYLANSTAGANAKA